MTSRRHNKIDDVERIDISDYIKEFVLYIRRKEGRTIDIRQFGAVNYMKELLDNPEYTRFKSTKSPDGSIYWDRQRVSYIQSNLGGGRGYLFYFNCDNCYRRVKYLYRLNYCYPPLCRICSNLSYKVPPRPRKFRDLSRIIRKPYFSSEDRHWIVKRAGITNADIPDNFKNG